jgi:hypothetical protein
LSLAFSYWIDYLGFVTEGKLVAIFIKPSLGVSNLPVVYFISYAPSNTNKTFSGTIHHRAINPPADLAQWQQSATHANKRQLRL